VLDKWLEEALAAQDERASAVRAAGAAALAASATLERARAVSGRR
jgi:hypothetical protein